ncbi:hypothetical protein [Wolbachia endosymbiont of Cantharis cryptica]|uniref:hypothetical protein n=1 Tax=Wolbachia endosymbiont of Cantharis cryptica TaxID=3066132 RepID=UPI00376F2E75
MTTLALFDCDNTLIWKHLHNYLLGLRRTSDYGSGKEGAVTAEDIKKFIENTGIKNEEELKKLLQYALLNEVEVGVVSYTGYPNAVKKIVEDYLGLSKEQAKNISVIGGFPKDYDPELKELSVKEQQDQVGKNLHICRAIKRHKDKHKGRLPEAVILIDDNKTNVERIKKIVKSTSERKGWLEANGLSIEAIENIKFEGVQAPTEKGGDDRYLERVKEFIRAHSKGKEITISLKEKMKEIRILLKKDGVSSEEAIYDVQYAFKEQVMEAIRGQGCSVSSEEGKSKITVKGSKPIDVEQIIQDNFSQFIELRGEMLKNENLRKEEPIYQNTIGEKMSSETQAEPVYATVNKISLEPV